MDRLGLRRGETGRLVDVVPCVGMEYCPIGLTSTQTVAARLIEHLEEQPPNADVAGLRLGLVGCGAIGQAVARLAAAFGMSVAAFDPGLPDEAGIEAVASLHALLARSDALSLHLPLLPSTRRLIGAAADIMELEGKVRIHVVRLRQRALYLDGDGDCVAWSLDFQISG